MYFFFTSFIHVSPLKTDFGIQCCGMTIPRPPSMNIRFVMTSWLQGHHCVSPKKAQIFHRHHTVSFSPYVCIPVGGSLPHVGSRWDVAFCTRRNKLVKSRWDVAFCTRRNKLVKGCLIANGKLTTFMRQLCRQQHSWFVIVAASYI